jgi:hypothetical protein
MRLPLISLAAAAAVAAAAVPAQAQEAPANSGPYFIMDLSEANLTLAAGGTRTRSGSQANVTVSVLIAADAVEDGIARLDMAYQFDCSGRRFRTNAAAGYGLDGGFLGAINDEPTWEAVNMDATTAVIMAYACDQTLPEGIEPIQGDIDTLAERYREIAAGE